jgi:hypothetical protein
MENLKRQLLPNEAKELPLEITTIKLSITP